MVNVCRCIQEPGGVFLKLLLVLFSSLFLFDRNDKSPQTEIGVWKGMQPFFEAIPN